LPLQAVEPRRLYRQIADQITQLIASGEFPPGERQRALRAAEALVTRRASVREAIISLEMGGLVEVRVGTGIFVTAPVTQGTTAGDGGPGPFELLQARRLVEGEIAALAASKASREDLEALRECVAHGSPCR
jgi:DNA-binding FadR family transcriptional regulator